MKIRSQEVLSIGQLRLKENVLTSDASEADFAFCGVSSCWQALASEEECTREKLRPLLVNNYRLVHRRVAQGKDCKMLDTMH